MRFDGQRWEEVLVWGGIGPGSEFRAETGENGPGKAAYHGRTMGKRFFLTPTHRNGYNTQIARPIGYNAGTPLSHAKILRATEMPPVQAAIHSSTDLESVLSVEMQTAVAL